MVAKWKAVVKSVASPSEGELIKMTHCKKCNSILKKYENETCGACIGERIDELEQKAWENMTGEDVVNNLSKEDGIEYYSLLGSN